jgi:ABC-type Fe3+-hydroxamate transport system substrate-binding protein
MTEGRPLRESMRDDLGLAVRLPRDVGRVVSLVPSLTEALAVTAPGMLIGATDWCTHPAGLDVVRVRGTKNPHVQRIVELAPDLVVANFEENREPDLETLRAAGLPVWVTVIRTLDEAFMSMGRLFDACGLGQPRWLAHAAAAWSRPHAGPRRHAVVPIWRRPWMVVGQGTFTGDVLRRLGVDNAYEQAAERYPRATPEHMRATGADLVVLPDEPYVFTADDGPEEFPGLDVALVSGRHLTWYGPSLVEAREVLSAQLAAARTFG